MVGELEGYGTVWYYADGIANILSLYRVSQRFHVTYDSHKENWFVVWKTDGTPRRFTANNRGLYYCNLLETEGTILTINTVDDKKIRFTNRQIQHAESTRKIQDTIGATTYAMIRVVDKQMIRNCHADRSSIKDAISIFGPSIPNLQGKTTRSTQGYVMQEYFTPIPLQFYHATKMWSLEWTSLRSTKFTSLSRMIT